MLKSLYIGFLGLIILCVCISKQDPQPFHMAHAEEQQSSVSWIKIYTSRESVESGFRLDGNVTAYDNAGKISTLSGGVVRFYPQSTGHDMKTLFSGVFLINGVVSFSMLCNTEVTSDVIMGAELSIENKLYTGSKKLRVNKNNSYYKNVDYTDYWVGEWNTQPDCDTATCCCLNGQAKITREGLNLVKLQSNVIGKCSMASVTRYIGGIYSDRSTPPTWDTSSTPQMSVRLHRNGNTLRWTDILNDRCNGSAVCTTTCPRSNTASSLKVVAYGVVVTIVSFLLFIH
ncbi:hypothetical protein C9374_001519 [Naegleria lovaniensis]|uniref:Uncharacterized protein n=1 Tax=Naegleria lovaniensis TaxID=51637 RepID=A0AA88GQU5_NAELO|nr:uncharacterized protein C9374_001519 [Naegleria lovaniensis]KAG2387187.1 hypothetical protein C9374_001519 [Naegleria lovaniensis]